MSTTNLIGTCGADKDNPTVVTFPVSLEVAVVIQGSGNARVAFNSNTPVNNTDAALVGGGPGYRFKNPRGITSLSLYVDTASSGASLTYIVAPLVPTI